MWCYKLITTKKKSQLFDLLADPSEKQDLAASHPKEQARMAAALATWKSGVMKELNSVGN